MVETEHVTFGLNEQDKIHFDDAKILNLKLLCEYSNNFKKEISELLELESKNIIDIFDSYLSKIKPENSYQRNDFYNKSNFLVELMLEVYNKDILAYLTDEVITEYNKVNPNIEIIYRTQILNNELGSKNKISKKLKI